MYHVLSHRIKLIPCFVMHVVWKFMNLNVWFSLVQHVMTTFYARDAIHTLIIRAIMQSFINNAVKTCIAVKAFPAVTLKDSYAFKWEGLTNGI